VVEIVHCLEIEQQRRLAVDPQRAGGGDRALDAMRAPVAQHHAHRVAGLAFALEVLLQAVEEVLDLFRRVQSAQCGEFGPGEPEHLAGRLFYSCHRFSA